MKILHPTGIAVMAAISLALAGASALAAETVMPGQGFTFPSSDRGEIACRVGVTQTPGCVTVEFTGTSANPAGRTLSTAVLREGRPIQQALPAAYAEASLYHDFSVGGAPGTFHNTQVRVDYDLRPALVWIIANAYAEVTLELEIRDVTSGAGFPVASHTVHQLRRDNTQGLSDVSGTQERQLLLGESAHFQAMLLSGRKYSLVLKLESMNGSSPGATSTRAQAFLNSLSIFVDEDEVALLDDLAVAVEQHDQDIKERLDGVDAQLEEIRELLVTPPGRRPDWNR